MVKCVLTCARCQQPVLELDQTQVLWKLFRWEIAVQDSATYTSADESADIRNLWNPIAMISLCVISNFERNCVV